MFISSVYSVTAIAMPLSILGISCHGKLTQKDPFAVLFSESKKHNPRDQKQETKIATQEQNAILTQLKTK